MKFYPSDQPVPAQLKNDEFLLAPLTPAHVHLDYAALMSSVQMLRIWSTSGWPSDDFSVADNMKDMLWHSEEHEERIAFTFTVLTPAEDECLGCLYIKPMAVLSLGDGTAYEPQEDYEAMARFWVKVPRLGDGLDERLLRRMIVWFQKDWPFSKLHWHANKQDTHQMALFDKVLERQFEATIPERGQEYVFYL